MPEPVLTCHCKFHDPHGDFRTSATVSVQLLTELVKDPFEFSQIFCSSNHGFLRPAFIGTVTLHAVCMVDIRAASLADGFRLRRLGPHQQALSDSLSSLFSERSDAEVSCGSAVCDS